MVRGQTDRTTHDESLPMTVRGFDSPERSGLGSDRAGSDSLPSISSRIYCLSPTITPWVFAAYRLGRDEARHDVLQLASEVAGAPSHWVLGSNDLGRYGHSVPEPHITLLRAVLVSVAVSSARRDLAWRLAGRGHTDPRHALADDLAAVAAEAPPGINDAIDSVLLSDLPFASSPRIRSEPLSRLAESGRQVAVAPLVAGGLASATLLSTGDYVGALVAAGTGGAATLVLFGSVAVLDLMLRYVAKKYPASDQ